MPPFLQRLPDELLDISFRGLLPPFRSQSLADTFVFTVPVDLLNLRLVSRRFHRLATPLAWRRAQLALSSRSSLSYGALIDTTNAHENGIRPSHSHRSNTLRSLARCQFLHEHPHLATHVRVLILSLSEWQSSAHAEVTRAALRAATQAMTSLRTVLVWDADALSVPDIQQLLQRPLLRAVCLMDLNGVVFPPESAGWASSGKEAGGGLQMLHVANTVCPARLINGAKGTLECVSIELATSGKRMGAKGSREDQPTLREMPWGTLKEVALVDCINDEDWVCFLEGFQLHKSLGLPSSLTELLIGDLSGLEPLRLTSLIRTFTSQPLTRLTLFHLPLLDPHLLTSIAHAFPSLTHLTLLTEGELVPWSQPLECYARPLSVLKHLSVLAWNNFSLEQEHATNCFMSMCEESLSKLYTRHVKAVAKWIKTIKKVKFVSTAEWVVDTAVVTKKGCAMCGVCHGEELSGRMKVGGCMGTFGDWMRGEELGPVKVYRTTQAALHTRSWSTRSGAFEDI
ncbi:hypothetical protein M422DRAFT_31847 [Sphaerobolus stellatus SS14]|uniref:F-box domain-containing protein n=1 Tax=Sphaerobolus stellatus (strain SS14) TaxID=990650 RepID=A0A0C9UDV1_SPHS4|nr:hypothetical protein M422DRAFT_31847 [Sphaerobolus stellatus SS14]